MRKKPKMIDVVVRFRVTEEQAEEKIDRLMRYGFEQIMEYEPETHKSIESWQMVPDYKQFLADAMAWRGYQARKTRLHKAGFGKSPLRKEQ